MDNKNEDIEKLLQKMKEENKGFKEKKNQSKKGEVELEDDEEEHNLQSRYQTSEKSHKNTAGKTEAYCEDSDSEAANHSAENPPKKKSRDKNRKLLKTTPQVKSLKQPSNKPHEATSNKKPQKRPQTARTRPKGNSLSTRKKSDTVALFWQRENEWKSNCFLNSNPLTTREGRKLNLASTTRIKDFALTKKKSINYIFNPYIAPHEKRRDEIRLQTRAKMMKIS